MSECSPKSSSKPFKTLALSLTILAISGCAVQGGITLPELSDWQTRNRILADLDDWEFKGRIGVSADGEGFNGKIRYWQNDDDFRATVSGPLGFGSIQIEGDGRHVTMTDKDGEEWMLPDPEVDLQIMYGWTIPVASLRYWALGIPDPNELAFTDINEEGLLTALEQGNWQIEIGRYRESGGQMMPRRLTAVSSDNKVRLVIDSWTFH